MNSFGFPDDGVPVVDRNGRITTPWRGYFDTINALLRQCVTGPQVSTDNAPALFDGTDGKKIKE